MREEVRALALHRLTRAREAFAEGDQPPAAGSQARVSSKESLSNGARSWPLRRGLSGAWTES